MAGARATRATRRCCSRCSAHAHLELKEYDRAVTVLMTAVKRDPLSAPALNSLGYMLAERGERLPEAVGFIERALKVDPDNPSYLDSLGWALHKQGKTDEAEPHLRRAADALPTQSVIQDHYGDVLVKRGKVPEAIGAWERALAGDGDDIDRAGHREEDQGRQGQAAVTPAVVAVVLRRDRSPACAARVPPRPGRRRDAGSHRRRRLHAGHRRRARV